MNSLKNNIFFKNTLVLFVGTMTAGVINYFFHSVIGRMVSVRVFGEMESLVSLLTIISVPSAAIAMAATQYGAGLKAGGNSAGNTEIIKYFYKRLAGYGLPFFAALLIITPWVGKFLKIENNFSLIIIWITMFLSFFSSVNGGIINGWQKFKEASAAGILGVIAKITGAVVLIRMGFELSGAIGGFAIGSAVSYGASFYILRSIAGVEKKSEFVSADAIDFSSMKKYMAAAFVGNLAISILGNADMVLAKHNLDFVQAGQYGALTIVSKIIFFVTGVIATVLFAMSAEDAHKKNGSSKALRNSALATLIVAIFSVAVYFIFPKLVLGILFGDKYLEAAGYLGWFALLVALFSFSNLLFQYLLSIRDNAIVYFYLAIAIIFSMSVLFFAKSIYAILFLAILAQSFAILSGIGCLIKRRNTLKSQ